MFNFFKKKKKQPKNLRQILECLEEVEKKLRAVSKDFDALKKENKKTFQKFGIVRFNPFKEVGSDQSFSIALLNLKNNGFVLTSQYGRESNRVFAKPINQGKSEYLLSKEEKEAIEQAISYNLKNEK